MNRCDKFIYNFRELGGIKSKDGRVIKNGFFYRGGPLLSANDVEKQEIDKLKLKEILDFRGVGEGNIYEKLYNSKNTHYQKVPALANVKLLDDDSLDLTVDSSLSKEELQMYEVYKGIFFNNDAFKLGVDYIKNNKTPIYFNCSAGKDRTGTFATLILLILDVSEDEIYKEYEKTNEWLKKQYKDYDQIPSINKVNRKWLKAGLNEINKKYKTIENYLEKEYGIDSKKREEIKNYYLEGEKKK